MAKLWIVRGLPGSGKSTYARKLTRRVFEADQLFTLSGKYKFSSSRLATAHALCQAQTFFAMKSGHDVAVANTFVHRWEYAPYVAAAALAGYDVCVVEMYTSFENVHGVPETVIQRMRKEWEPETDLPTLRIEKPSQIRLTTGISTR